MELFTALLYTQLSGFILPQSRINNEPIMPLVMISAQVSASNRFVERVLGETVFTSQSQVSEYSVPQDNMPHASAMGIALGMLKAMKIEPKRFGQSRISGLAYTLVMNKTIRRRARGIRAGDNFKLVIDQTGHIHLNINQSTARSRAVALSKMMSLRPEPKNVKRRTAFKIGKAHSYVQQVAQKSKVMKEAQRVEYIVHGDDIPNASAMGTALGMLHALKIKSSDFGQTRLQGLALRLVLRREIRRKARSFHKGDRFVIRSNGLGKIALNIYTGKHKSFKSDRLKDVIENNIANRNEDSKAVIGDDVADRKDQLKDVIEREISENEDKKDVIDKKEADQQMAAFSQEGSFTQVEEDVEAAFKPENIIKHNINAIINETVTGLKVSADKEIPLRKDLHSFLTDWSQKAQSVDKTFVNGFLSVIAKDLIERSDEKAKDQALESKMKVALLKGLQAEHDFYDTKEEALVETAKQILETVKEIKEAEARK